MSKLPKWHEGHLIERLQTKHLTAEVRELMDYRWLHFGDAAVQSMMRLSSPATPTLTYSRCLLLSLCFVDQPRSALNLGVGGGTFERFFAHYYPNISLDSVDLNPSVIELAQRHFFLSKDINVTIADAAVFMDGNDRCYDLIYCDLFKGIAHGLDHTRPDFLSNVCRQLSSSGLFALNLMPDSSQDALNCIVALKQKFAQIWVLNHPQIRNLILFCKQTKEDSHPEVEAGAVDLQQRLGMDLSDLLPHLKPIT